MPNDRTLRYATLGGLVLVLVLLVLVLLQVHGLEKRFIGQGQQLRALGEATERLGAGGGARVARTAAGSTGDEIPPGVKVLHPEVENYLKPQEMRWPPPGASLTGVLARGWEYGEPKGFNALLENAAILSDLIQQYAGIGLATRNRWTNPDNYYGDLAWRAEVTDDVKEFTFYLRPGFEWHAPAVNLDDPKYAWLRGRHPVTAHDIVFTVELINNPQVQSGHWKNYYTDVESVKAVDDHTFVIRWKKKQFTNYAFSLELWPTPRFLYENDENGKPVPKETLGLRFNQHWYNNKGYLGAGPYRMASYVPGSKITLERNEAYPGDKPAIKTLVYPIYSDLKQTVLKLKAHEIGVGELQPGQYREEILEHERAGRKPANSPFFDGRIRCEKVPRLAYSYIAWNAGRPMFADKRVRRAMTLALDRQRIIDSVWAGLGEIITGPFNPASPNADPSIQPLRFDLEAARRLLAEAGWQDTNGDGLLDKELHAGDGKRSPFEFRYSFLSGHKESESTAKIFAEDLLKIGVKMHLDGAEWSLLTKRKDERQYDAYTMSWTMPWEPDLFQVWHSSQADIPKGSNAVSFRHKEADKIIEELRVTFDRAERTRLFRAFHRFVDDEQPYTFFMIRKKVFCGWNDVKNFVFAKDYPVESSFPWWIDTAP